ncbi:MAG: hypothetical protein B7Z73_11555, partial [Planctomycetia bacterium 21-64-5]
ERAAVDHAIDHSFVREAVMPERKVLTEALKRGLGTLIVEKTARELKERPLIRSEVDGRAMATTKNMLASEKKLVEFARDGRGRCRPLGDPKRPCSRPWFNEGQKAAVAHVLGSRDRVMAIRGVAGTGKTTLEQEIGEAVRESGRPVVALAQGSSASRDVLRKEAGFESADTVARFLRDEQMQQSARDGVILVDEASQLGSHDMLDVFRIAEEKNARVLLVGDRRQHRSVTAGEPLKLLEKRAGLPVAELGDILRQQGDYKKVAKLLSEGEAELAFELLDKLGWIREAPDGERNQQIASAYISAVAEKKKHGEHKSALVVAPTHAEGTAITSAIRAQLKEHGELKGERIVTSWVSAKLTEAQRTDPTEYNQGDMVQFQQNAKGYTKGARIAISDGVAVPVEMAKRFELYRPQPMALAEGDRIRVTAGGKTKDGKHRLSTGALFTVEGFTKHGDIVVDHGWVIDRDFGHIAHGYVVTSHASQGKTVDKVIVAISSQSLPATDQRTAYVAVTRGKEQALVFTDNHEELMLAVQRGDRAMSATELAELAKPESGSASPKRIRFGRIAGLFASGNDRPTPELTVQQTSQELSHDR